MKSGDAVDTKEFFNLTRGSFPTAAVKAFTAEKDRFCR
jgi:hypothetical protein